MISSNLDQSYSSVNVSENSYPIPWKLRPLFRSKKLIDIQIEAGSTIARAALADRLTSDTPIDTRKKNGQLSLVASETLKTCFSSFPIVCTLRNKQRRKSQEPGCNKSKLLTRTRAMMYAMMYDDVLKKKPLHSL